MFEEVLEFQNVQTTTREFYIDYENVGSSGLDGIVKLEKSDNVYVYYGDEHATMTLNTHMDICISNCKMIFKQIKMPVKNAVDCKILFDVEDKIKDVKPIEICIVSNDTDYDKAIEIFNSVGVKVSRSNSIEKYLNPSVEKDNLVRQQNIETNVRDFCKKHLKGFNVDDNLEEIVKIVVSSKTKTEVNNGLLKLLKDSKLAGKIYKELNPFVNQLLWQ